MSISQKIQQFYNKTPFPDYELERFSDKEDLKLHAFPFARILDSSMPENASVIDVGTGTGQLSAFLSLRRKCVWGIDFSDSPLKKARALKKKLKLDSLHLKKIDIMDEGQIKSIETKFDYVLCLGVLHHTENPCIAFRNISNLLKPGGHIAIGLYNKFGRIPLKTRKFFVKTMFRGSEPVKNWLMSRHIVDIQDKERVRGWWNDQYFNPHETTHTVDEVLGWFRKNNIEYCQTIPSLILFNKDDVEITGIWNNSCSALPNCLVRLYKQISWMVKAHDRGGYWITLGRKKK